ncbi:hypothetical protein ACJ73_09554, partial [Blastomyces percursus]
MEKEYLREIEAFSTVATTEELRKRGHGRGRGRGRERGRERMDPVRWIEQSGRYSLRSLRR